MMKYVESGSGFKHSVGYEYDNINNLSAPVETINGVTRTTSYEYDDDNRIKTVTNSREENTTADDITEEYTYDSYGRVTTKVTKNGSTTILTEEYTYKTNALDQPTSQVATMRSVSGGRDVTYTYTYDSNGNITSVSDGTYTTTYTYDSANQLIQEDNQDIGLTWIYEYDDAGNILRKEEYAYTSGSYLGGEPYTYGDSEWGDLLTKRTGRTITYDAIGNMLAYNSWTYTWEHGRELAALTSGSERWTFTYDANGMRTSRTNGSRTYSYVYNGSSLSRMTVDGHTLDFTYDAEGKPLALTYDGVNYYYALNLQGDVVAILDSSGSEVVSYTYDAWSNIVYILGSHKDTVGFYNPLRYRGYVYDEGYGLYYLQSRYYNPYLFRFINADAYAATGQGILGNNMFAYCLNNPANCVDVTGTDAVWIQEKERGGGYGHTGLLVEDANGNWYFLYWGSAGESSTIQKILGTPYEFVFVKIDVSGYDLTSMDDVILALQNSDNSTAQMRSQYVTGTIYFEGDYSKTYEHLETIHQKELSKPGSLKKYGLITNNCVQFTWKALEKSDPSFRHNGCPILPNNAFTWVTRMRTIAETVNGWFS